MPNWKEHTEKWTSGGSQFEKTHLYSPNMGTIEEYEAEFGYEGCLSVKCNGVRYLITQKSTATRVKGFVGLSIVVEKNSDKKAIERELKEIASLTGNYYSLGEKYPDYIGGGKTTDPRIVRAYILMWYEYFKEHCPTHEEFEPHVNALLNKSLDLSVADAAE